MLSYWPLEAGNYKLLVLAGKIHIRKPEAKLPTYTSNRDGPILLFIKSGARVHRMNVCINIHSPPATKYMALCSPAGY